MIVKKQLTGVVLAGGQSSRFGSDKTIEEIGGITFLEHIVSLLRPLFTEVMVSENKEHYAVISGYRLIKDEYEACGSLGGIHAALKSFRTAYVLFLTCDMPLMKTAPLYRMLAEVPSPVVGWASHEERGGIFPLLVSNQLVAKVEQRLINGNRSIHHSLFVKERTQMLELPFNGHPALSISIEEKI